MLHSANSQSTLQVPSSCHKLWIVTKRMKVWIKVAIFIFFRVAVLCLINRMRSSGHLEAAKSSAALPSCQRHFPMDISQAHKTGGRPINEWDSISCLGRKSLGTPKEELRQGSATHLTCQHDRILNRKKRNG